MGSWGLQHKLWSLGSGFCDMGFAILGIVSAGSALPIWISRVRPALCVRACNLQTSSAFSSSAFKGNSMDVFLTLFLFNAL
jgi:hypothetical protein